MAEIFYCLKLALLPTQPGSEGEQEGELLGVGPPRDTRNVQQSHRAKLPISSLGTAEDPTSGCCAVGSQLILMMVQAFIEYLLP